MLGSAIIYIFPPLLFLATSRREFPSSPPRLAVLERWWCRGLVLLGAVLAVLGGGVTVLSTFTNLLP